MGKAYCSELKIEFNDFTVSLRGGWLVMIILVVLTWYRCLVYIPPQRRFVFKGLQLRHVELFCINSKFMHSMWNSHRLSTSVLFWTCPELCWPPTSSSWTISSDYAIMSSRSSPIFLSINSSFSYCVSATLWFIKWGHVIISQWCDDVFILYFLWRQETWARH